MTRLSRLLSAIGLVAFAHVATAQTDPIPGNYKDNFTQGNFLLLEENYPMALKFFQEAYRTDSSSANINYKVGVCLLKSVSQKNSSLYYLRRAAKDVTRNYDDIEPRIKKAPEDAFYYLAQAYHLNSLFDSAQSYFESYKTLIGTKNPELLRDVNHRIEMCKNAKEFTASPLPVKITNLGDSINSIYPDYGAVMSLDENIIYYTSRRYGERGIDGLYLEDIFVSYRKADNTWTSPVPLLGVNTDQNEATISLSTDGQTLFLYRDDNGGDIYFSTQDFQGNWSKPQPMEGDINSKAWETHATLSADGNTLYFASDRKGGYGGRDIYRCVRINNRWSKAFNLGPTINTPYDEDAPFIHPDKTTLFFSSSGHKSMGGFDIFFTAQDDSGHWAEPINMGYPINTPDDDVFYITSVDGKRAYFSSVREGSYGDKDIYMAELAKSQVDAPLTLLKGRIYNADGSPLTQDVQVVVTNNETGELVGNYRPNPKSGYFSIILAPGASYKLSYLVNGTEYYSEVINVPADADYGTYEQAFSVSDLMLGKVKSVQGDSTKTHPVDNKNPKEELMTIDGQLMSKANPAKPIDHEVKVVIKNDKGELLGESLTKSGNFTFEHLSAKSNYLILVDEFVTVVAPLRGLTLTNEVTGDPLINTKTSTAKQDDKFKVTSTGKFITVRLLKAEPENFNIPKNVKDSLIQTLTTTKGLHFQMFFKYNVSEIDQDDEDFKSFIDSLAQIINAKGSIKLKLDAAASQVPTRKFATNKDLSKDRAEKCQASVMTALRARGIDESKVTWVKVNYYVLGPTYKSDFLKNKAVYEKYQYVKIKGFK